MSSLLEVTAESEIYFTDNWTDTEIQYPNTDFEYVDLDTWIAIDTYPALLSCSGLNGTTTGRTMLECQTRIFCYHRKLKDAIALADDVRDFFSGVALPKDINVNVAQYSSPVDLENGFFEVKVIFDIIQYS